MKLTQYHHRHIRKHLKRLVNVKRKHHHHLLHHLHKKYGISKKTLFYVKEYGEHSNVVRVIIKESIKVLLFASLISSFGGLGLEYIKSIFLSLTPLIILLPAMNDMIGDYSMIISSRYSTMLHEGIIVKRWWHSKEIRTLFLQIIIISAITTIISASIALFSSTFTGFMLTKTDVYKIIGISLIDTLLLVSILFSISIYAGTYYFNNKEDPNNFLIPISTSIADLGNTLIMSALVFLFF